ncbi:BCNT-domain-containing protein [Coccomyxa subellipsoidea C-169]|uniref:BCNT-domain-containing protein n=1 Tax=Coccomyxa subellipsoidea (strain C-169) TaxID=574566 RepID=I0YUP2_COCSC|nr:BCNT-domain-containing protein [Coccomyxa subellipsoidea C-169]EIE22111.1 BCNT-domain-containing protein [Coccomyxa subellipsoidea C-169]|eukprot:XP_005646655.1 BCNT-domain-containing protein [Coccomyxa subellipsoidea C-169]
MANIVNAPDLPSEDDEDDDYDPSRDPDAEKEDANGKKAKLAGGRSKRNSGQIASGEDVADEDDDADAEEQQEIVPHSKAATKKAKVNALWDQLQQGSSGARASDSAGASSSGNPPKAPARGGNDWGALCRPVPKGAPKEDKNRNWMLQLGFKGASQGSKGDSPAPAGQLQKAPCTGAETEGGSDRQESGPSTSKPQSSTQVQASESKPAVSLAAAAMAAAKAAASSSANGKIAVTETRRFAGKNIEMTRQVSVSAAAAEAEAEKQKRNKAGLDAVLASLQAAKKVNVLDKSRSDWSTFKQSDTQVEEELEAYKKSGDKYLDKVDFLKRSELRQYEKERDARLAGDIRSRGRL